MAVPVICFRRGWGSGIQFVYKGERGSACAHIFQSHKKMKTDLKFRQLLSFFPVLTIDSCVPTSVPLREVCSRVSSVFQAINMQDFC